MASTVREFAVKITADTKEFQTGLDTAIKQVTDLANSLKNLFSGSNDIKKAAGEVSKAISELLGNIGKDAKTQMDEAIKNIANRLNEVEKGSKAEERLLADAQKAILKIQREAAKEAERLEKQKTQDAARSAKEQTKVVEDEIKKLSKVGGQFKLSAFEIDKVKPVKDVQDLGRILATNQKNTQEKIRRELKALDSQSIEDIRQGRDNLIQIITQANAEQEEAIRQSYQLRLELAGDNAEERVKIEEEMQDELEKAAKDGQARIEATERTAGEREKQAPNEKQIGRIGRGGAIIGTLQQQAQGAVGALGPLGSALGKLGPIGLAVGAGIGLLVGGFKKAAEASAAFNDSLAKIRTTIDPGQFDALNSEMARMREFSVQTGVSIDQLSEGVFNAASAVAAFKTDVGAAVDAVQIASKAAVGMSADSGQLVSVMGDLANSFGINASDSTNLSYIMDNMTQTFIQGKVQGSELADTIVLSAKSMSLLAKDAKTGVKDLSAMTAAMTASGVDSNRTATALNSLNNELLDMDTATKLATAGLGGISTEGGKVTVDFQELFKSAGDDFEKFAQMIGSDKAKLAFRTLAGSGESAFLAVSQSFNDVTGVADTAFDQMQNTSEAASKRLDAALNDIGITFGGTADNLITDIDNLAASVLGGIAQLFKSTDQQLGETQGNFDKFAQLSETIGSALTDTTQQLNDLQSAGITSGEGVDAAIAQIGATASQFKDQFPLMAEDIQKIINAPGEKTVETLALLNQKLTQTQELANAETFLSGFEAFDLGLEKVDDTLDDISTNLIGIVSDIDVKFNALDVLGPFRGLSDMVSDLDNLDLTSNLQAGLGMVEDRLSELREEQSTVDATTIEGAERLREIQGEVKDLMIARSQIQKSMVTTDTEIEKLVNQEVSNAQKLAAINGEKVNVDELISNLQYSITEQVGAQGQFAEMINQKVIERATLLAKETGDTDALKLIEAERLETEIQSLNAKMLQAEIFGTLTDEQRDAIQIQIASLEIEQDHLDAKYDNVNAQDDLNSAGEYQIGILDEQNNIQQQNVDLTDEQAYIADEVNAIASEILDNEALSTEEKIAQLENEEMILQNKEEELRTQIQILNTQIAEQNAIINNNKESAEAQEIARKTAENIREQVRLLSEEAAIASEAAAQFGVKIEGAKTGAKVSKVFGGRSRAGRGGGGRSSEDKAAKEAEKAAKKAEKDAEKEAKDAAKRQEELAKKAEKAAEDRAKFEEKLLDERKKREEIRQKQEMDALDKQIKAQTEANKARYEEEKRLKAHAEALALAEKKIREDVKKFADDLKTQSMAFVGQSVSAIEQLIIPFQSQAEKTFKSLQQISRDAAKVIADTKKQIADLTTEKEQKAKTIGESKARIDVLNLDKDVLAYNTAKASLEDVNEQIEKLERGQKLYESDIKSAEKEVKKLGDEYSKLEKKQKSAGEAVSFAAGATEYTKEYEDALKTFKQFETAVGGGGGNKGTLASTLDKQLRDMGASVKNGRIEFQGLVETFGPFEEQVESVRRILAKLSSTQTKTNDDLGKMQDTYNDLTTDMNNAWASWSDQNQELITLRGELAKETGFRDLDELNKQLTELTKLQKQYNGTVESNAGKVGDQKTEIDNLTESIKKLNAEIKGIEDEIKLAEETLTANEPGKLSKAEAQSRVKQYESVALGFSQVSEQLEKVIQAQNQAFASVDPTEAAKKYMDADKELKKIMEDFDLFGISIQGLIDQTDALAAENVEDILNAIYGDPNTEDLSDADKMARERTKVLLESAINLLKLQTKSKDAIIAMNQELDDTIIKVKELEARQASYNDLMAKMGEFLKVELEDNRTELEKVNDQIRRIQVGLMREADTIRAIVAEQQILIEKNKENLDTTQEDIDAQERKLQSLKEQKEEALKNKDVEAVERLNNEIAKEKNILDTLVEAQRQYQQNIDNSTAAIENQSQKMDTLVQSSESLNAIGKVQRDIATDKDVENARQKEIADREKALDLVKSTLSEMEKYSDLAFEVADGISQIENSFAVGNPAAGIATGADLTKKIGTALLEAPYPLNIAGAVLLSAGIIGGMVAKIWTAIAGREQTSEERAQERSDTLQLQNDTIRAQMSLMKDLQDIGDASVDTARERLALMQEQRRELIRSNRIAAMFANNSAQELMDKKDAIQAEIDLNELYKKRFENAKELSEADQRALIEEARQVLGYELDYGNFVSEADLDRFISNLNGEIISKEDQIKTIDLLLEMDQSQLDEELNIIDERISSAEFKVEIATVLGDTDALLDAEDEMVTAMRDRLQTAVIKAGVFDQVGDIASMTFDQIKELDWEAIFAGGEIPQEIIDSWSQLIGTIDDTIDSQMAYLDTQMEEWELDKELIDARKEAGKIDDLTARKETLSVLEEQLQYLLDQEKILGSSKQLTIKILELQAQINDLKNEGNDIDSESNKLLMESIRLRQQQIEQFRRQQKGGTLTSDQQKALDKTDDEIRTQLKASGMTDQQIEEFMKQLPAFEKGTPSVPETGLALVHKGERITPANQVKEEEDLIRQFAEILGMKNPIANGTDRLTQEFSRIILEKETMGLNQSVSVNTTLGDIVINIPQGIKEPERVASMVKTEIANTITGVVQRAIDQNKLDFRGKRI